MSASRILIVEDDSYVALLLEFTVVKLGYAVCGTEYTEDGAVATAIRRRPDAMIVDVGLVQGSGLRAVNRILAERYVPHVFISANRLDHRGLHPLAVRLRKPFRDVELAASLSQVFPFDHPAGNHPSASRRPERAEDRPDRASGRGEAGGPSPVVGTPPGLGWFSE